MITSKEIDVYKRQLLDLKLNHPHLVSSLSLEKGIFVSGFLRSTYNKALYFYDIYFKYPKMPKAVIKTPEIFNKTKHVYGDGSLCLYHHKSMNFDPSVSLLGETVVPWTILWVEFFEGWLETGEWVGPEHKH